MTLNNFQRSPSIRAGFDAADGRILCLSPNCRSVRMNMQSPHECVRVQASHASGLHALKRLKYGWPRHAHHARRNSVHSFVIPASRTLCPAHASYAYLISMAISTACSAASTRSPPLLYAPKTLKFERSRMLKTSHVEEDKLDDVMAGAINQQRLRVSYGQLILL